LNRAFLGAALVAALSVSPAYPQSLSLTLLTYQQTTVGEAATTVYTWTTLSRGIMVSNDSGSDIAIRFGDGDPDTATGEGGGILKAGESAWFPVRTLRVTMRCASGSAQVRMWAYKP
jgi:hypothetical protein